MLKYKGFLIKLLPLGNPIIYYDGDVNDNGSMSKTLKLEAKTPKKKLLKKTMTKTRKSDFILLKTYFLSFYSYFSPYIFL